MSKTPDRFGTYLHADDGWWVQTRQPDTMSWTSEAGPFETRAEASAWVDHETVNRQELWAMQAPGFAVNAIASSWRG